MNKEQCEAKQKMLQDVVAYDKLTKEEAGRLVARAIAGEVYLDLAQLMAYFLPSIPSARPAHRRTWLAKALPHHTPQGIHPLSLLRREAHVRNGWACVECVPFHR